MKARIDDLHIAVIHPINRNLTAFENIVVDICKNIFTTNNFVVDNRNGLGYVVFLTVDIDSITINLSIFGE